MSEHLVIGGKKYLILKTGFSSNKSGTSSPIIKFKEKKAWNTHQTFELIRLYRDQPSLYETDNPEYQNRASRKAAYKCISQGLAHLRPHTTEEEIRMKWNSLRTQFMREYSKVKKAAEDGNPFKPGMLFYESLLFLKDIEAARKDIIIVDEPEISINEDSTEFVLNIGPDSDSKPLAIEEASSDANTHISNTDHSYESKPPMHTSESPPAKKAKEVPKKDKNIYALVVDANHVKSSGKTFNTTIIPRPILPAPTTTVSTLTKVVPEGKQFDGFCQYIGETLRSLPLAQARKLEQRLLTSLITFMSNSLEE